MHSIPSAETQYRAVRARAAALIRTVAPPRAIVEEWAHGVPAHPDNPPDRPGQRPMVRVIQPPLGFGHIPHTFLDAKEVCDRFDILGDDLASLHYEVYLFRIGIK